KADNDKWDDYLKIITKAVSSFKDCKNDRCGCYKKVIDNDLKPWRLKKGITKEIFDKAANQGSHRGAEKGSHYQIINHKVYRHERCTFPARCKGIEHFLKKIAKKLPNLELIINTHDWPKVPKWDELLPVFSFSKTHNENDIMYPAWSFWEGGPAVWPIFPNGLGRWDVLRKSLQKASDKWPWDKKKSIAFFRGSRTSAERDPLILLSRAKPKLVNASYTKNQAWRSKADTLGEEPAKEVTLEDHCKYKYLFNFRGVAASFRFRHLFLCNSVVLHIGHEWQEFFYPALTPWVHYIPVDPDQRNTEEIIRFAIENDEEMKRLAKRGRDFILNHLRMKDVECYWELLLKQYAKLLKWKPQLNPSFDLVS
ncbi:uncharacterized protein TRIADDRAFT_18924, partial [Trichoplax adhaerens]